MRSSDDADAHHGMHLPFVVSMTRPNGAFHDVYSRSLASAMLTVRQGGVMAV